MIQNITVVGGGSTGFAATAWLTAKGFRVTLCDDASFAGEFGAIQSSGGILLRGKAGLGLFEPARVTTNPAEAVPDAELIIFCVPANRHEAVARWIAPHVKAGQDILISPGNLGSFIVRRVFDAMNVTGDLRISELEGNICPCRLTGPAEATVGLPIRGKRIACMRGGKTSEVIRRLEGVFDWIPNRNVFECALLSDNYVLHIGTCVLSATAIEKMGQDFIMFQHALTPASLRCVELVQQERRALLLRLGLKERDSAVEFLEELYHWEQHPEYSVFRTLAGPDRVSHRYIHEDSLACGALALSFAERLDVPMPVLRSIITLAGALTGVNYLAQGRTLTNLGFPGDMTAEAVMAAVSA